MSATRAEDPVIGEHVDGIDVPVVNERAVRASAGLLFLFGIIAVMTAALTGDLQLLRAFGIVFLSDMALRLFVGTRYTPSLIVASLIVRRQRPEWVGAQQKKLAWAIGLGLGFVSCAAMGFLGASVEIQVALCSICLSLLFIESAFGICVGCELQRLFSREKPQLCAGDTCTYVAPKRAERHSIRE